MIFLTFFRSWLLASPKVRFNIESETHFLETTSQTKELRYIRREVTVVFQKPGDGKLELHLSHQIYVDCVVHPQSNFFPFFRKHLLIYSYRTSFIGFKEAMTLTTGEIFGIKLGSGISAEEFESSYVQSMSYEHNYKQFWVNSQRSNLVFKPS